tara:strand:+ start:1226 stop:1474 length:249 start_codon:yes stop_codon:yes gene_type:complete
MSILETIIFFLIIWWPIFFTLLPLGFKPITDDDKNTEFVRSAPRKPEIIKKVIYASMLALIFTLLVWMLVYFELFSFKNIIK